MTAGKAAKDREDYKIKKYRNIYANQSSAFEPFVVESFGRFGDRTRDVFNEIVDRVHAAKPHYSVSFLKHYWKSRIVIALHTSGGRGVSREWTIFAVGAWSLS